MVRRGARKKVELQPENWLTQYGERSPGDPPRNELRSQIGETDMSMIMGRLLLDQFNGVPTLAIVDTTSQGAHLVWQVFSVGESSLWLSVKLTARLRKLVEGKETLEGVIFNLKSSLRHSRLRAWKQAILRARAPA